MQSPSYCLILVPMKNKCFFSEKKVEGGGKVLPDPKKRYIDIRNKGGSKAIWEFIQKFIQILAFDCPLVVCY